MSGEGVVRVRYGPGVVGETKRVVHLAVRLPSGAYFGLCETVIGADEAEVLDGPSGMPCMVCVRVMSLGSQPGTGDRLGAVPPEIVP